MIFFALLKISYYIHFGCPVVFATPPKQIVRDQVFCVMLEEHSEIRQCLRIRDLVTWSQSVPFCVGPITSERAILKRK